MTTGKHIFEIEFNNDDVFYTELITAAEAIDMCWDCLIQNRMENDTYRIGYWDNMGDEDGDWGEYHLVAIVSRKRRSNGRISTKCYRYDTNRH